SEYDSEVNSAEAFLTHLRDNRVKAFTNYNLLRVSYENWCSDYGFVPLGTTSLKRVMTQIAKAETIVFRDDEKNIKRWYFIDGNKPDKELVSLNSGMHVGLKATETEKDPVPMSEQQKLGEDW